MKLRKWLENWDMTKLKIKTPLLDTEWSPQEKDKDAAWELYIEMLTRIATQPLPIEYGDEKTALASIYSLFALTREVTKKYGRDSINFAKIAVVILNQIIRPFTAKWHGLIINGTLDKKEGCLLFREELELLRVDLRHYCGMLADMAGVEDLTNIQDAR